MKRWYDRYPRLAGRLEALKDMPESSRDPLIKGVMGLIKRHGPDILEDFLLDFPLDLFRRRWYDCDPYLWLMFNGLEHAQESLKETVTLYLETATGAPSPAKKVALPVKKVTRSRATTSRALSPGRTTRTTKKPARKTVAHRPVAKATTVPSATKKARKRPRRQS